MKEINPLKINLRTLEGLQVEQPVYRVVHWTNEEFKGPKKTILVTLDKEEAINLSYKIIQEKGLLIGIVGRKISKEGGFSNWERQIKN